MALHCVSMAMALHCVSIINKRWHSTAYPWGKTNQVDSYRYLGIHLDNLFSWQVHVDHLCSRLQQRLYFLRRLGVFGVDQEVTFLFDQAVLESILRYRMSAWYGNLSRPAEIKN